MNNAKPARNYSRLQTKTVVRENRLPACIAELIGRAHLKGQVVRDFLSTSRKKERELQAGSKIRSISHLRDELTHERQTDGETSRRWQRKASAEHISHRRDTTNGKN